jgi:hypothetical protein
VTRALGSNQDAALIEKLMANLERFGHGDFPHSSETLVTFASRLLGVEFAHNEPVTGDVATLQAAVSSILPSSICNITIVRNIGKVITFDITLAKLEESSYRFFIQWNIHRCKDLCAHQSLALSKC